jgi:DNA helicase HerA-like ATPase
VTATLLGPGLPIDVDRLVSTRLLVNASSGAGKSWCLRRLLEQTHGHVQQLVIDPEGEFATLRERFDYVLAAPKGGDVGADPRSAAVLAERLLELRVSAILDIYELKPRDRIAFVQHFCAALVNAPKALWHPVLVVLDEAHAYAPEAGDAASADAVSDLATRGRKRGFCLLAATQRLAMLSKDVAAQCNNVLTGRTTLDTDVKRAAYTLGFTTAAEKRRLHELEDGEFFAFGPAFSRTVTKVHVGPVQTTHPKAGGKQHAFTPPPPTAMVKAALSKLADLPAEVEAREKTVADLQAELTATKRELATAKRAAPVGSVLI